MAEAVLSFLIEKILSQLASLDPDQERYFPGYTLSDSQITSGQGNNHLHIAAKYREIAHVKSILGSHPFLAHKTNVKGDTPLHIAARLGKLDVATCLVESLKGSAAEAEYKKILRVANSKKNTALHEAVLNGHYDVADLLIEEDSILTSFDNEAGESPLFLAVEGGHEKIALRILETLPDCSIWGRNGMTVMHAAVVRAEANFVGKLLEKFDPEILEIPDDFCWMPHHYAANLGRFRVLKRILERNSTLATIKDIEGMSALHISAKNGDTRVIKTLIESCPDVCELLDKKGRTALHVAVEHKQVFALYAFLHNTIAFNDLLNEQDNEGNTALHLACIHGHYKIIMALLGDPRTNKRTINKKGMSAFDNMNRSSVLGSFDKFMIKSRWRLNDPRSLEEARAVARDTREKLQKETSPETDDQVPKQEGSSYTDHEKENERLIKDRSVKHTADINLLVATIIASITFTAAMNMPGGYADSDGLANLRKRTSFQSFLAFDSLAFGCSAGSMVMHFAVTAQSKLRGKAYKYPIHLTTLLTFLSITLAVLAFITGTYTALYENKVVPNSKSSFGFPGNIAFAAFFATLLYFFVPLVLAYFIYLVVNLTHDRHTCDVLVGYITGSLLRARQTMFRSRQTCIDF